MRELRIENLLLIERAELRFGPGLNVLTGETGAGKTVLAHSLDLLMGGKARRNILRPGATEAWIEGVFDLPAAMAGDPDLAPILERLPEGSEELMLGRRVSASGRTSAFIGGRAATAGELALLASRLIAFYGQHEHRRLTIGAVQTAMVDGAGHRGHAALRERYRECWGAFRDATAELEQLAEASGSERDLDLYRFELDEIEAAAPEPGESGELETERVRLQRSEELREATATAAARVRGQMLGESTGMLGELAAVRSLLAPLKGVDRKLDELDLRLESLGLELDDAGQELAAIGEEVEGDPERLSRVEERLDLLTRLERKHGGTIERVLEHAEWCRREIQRIEGGAARERSLREELEARRATLADAAAKLGESRRKAAADLAGRITADLAELAMEGAEFTIELKPAAGGPGPSGSEFAEFMLAPNPGMAARPLRDTASGGELSRVMLAIEVVLAASDPVPTFVFDEVDAGVGGASAIEVGRRLARLAEHAQVIVVTHLAQVAAFATNHLVVVKGSDGAVTSSDVRRLDGPERVAEMARLLSGLPDSATGLEHARELLALAAADAPA